VDVFNAVFEQIMLNAESALVHSKCMC